MFIGQLLEENGSFSNEYHGQIHWKAIGDIKKFISNFPLLVVINWFYSNVCNITLLLFELSSAGYNLERTR
jgi:hypothetical protein